MPGRHSHSLVRILLACYNLHLTFEILLLGYEVIFHKLSYILYADKFALWPLGFITDAHHNKNKKSVCYGFMINFWLHAFLTHCLFLLPGPESDGGILPRSLNVIFNSIEGRVYAQNNIKPHRCRDFTRLTKDQQDEDSTNKRNLMRLSKEVRFNSKTSRTISPCFAFLMKCKLVSSYFLSHCFFSSEWFSEKHDELQLQVNNTGG